METHPLLQNEIRKLLARELEAPTFNDLGESDTFLTRAQELIDRDWQRLVEGG